MRNHTKSLKPPDRAFHRPWGPPWAWTREHRPAPVSIVALVVAIVQLGGTFGAAFRQHDTAGPNLIAVVLLLAGPAFLLLRRRAPVITLVAVAIITGLYYAADFSRGPAILSLVVALFVVARQGNRLVAWLVVGLTLAGNLVHSVLSEESVVWSHLILIGVWLSLVVVVAEAIRSRRLAMAEAARVYAEEQRRRVSEERLNIARELHDVLAHNISLINVQAGVALHLLDDDPEQARTALAAIKQASKDTLQEMRSVLGVLRQVDEQAPKSPAVSLAQLNDLVRHSLQTGLDVSIEIHGQQRPLPTSLDQSTYRIVQEALTNMAKHSHSSTAKVLLDYGDVLTVTIEDSGPIRQADDDVGGTGNGIPGMMERAAAVGEELIAEPKLGGGFRVIARLPLPRQDPGGR